MQKNRTNLFLVKIAHAPLKPRASFQIIRNTIMILMLFISSTTIAQNITVSAKKSTMSEVISILKKQTGYAVFGNVELLEKASPVTVVAKDMPLEDFLKAIFRNQPIAYRMGNKTIFLSPKNTSQEKGVPNNESSKQQITGKVTDTLGKPVPGANIRIKSQAFSVSSDANGEFIIEVNPNDELIISYVGYLSNNVKFTPERLRSLASTNNKFTTTLSADISELGEVKVTINTGYQSIARERSAGSVSKPDMEVYRNRVGSMNVIQRLDGLIPGLTVNNAPGADQFQVRGLTTVGSTINIGGFAVPTTNRTPLFIVDGVPYEDINLLNPNDVMDVNVLKDATAASIWGTKAANGVIVITTKSGGKGNKKLKIEYNSFVRFQQRPDLSYLPMLNSAEYIKAATETFDATVMPWESVNSTATPFVAPHELVLYNLARELITQQVANAKLDSMSRLSNLDQMSKLFYQNSLVTNHSLSVGGSSDKYSYYGSFNYTGNRGNGNLPGNNSDNFKLNLRQDFNISKNVSLYLITDISNNVGNSKPVQSFDSRFTPYQMFRDEQGNDLDLSWRYLTDELRATAESKGKIGLPYLPVQEADYGYTKTNNLAARLNAGLKVNLFKGLRFEGTYGYVRGKNDVRQFEDQKAYKVRKEVLSYAMYTSPTVPVNYYMPKTGGKLTTINNSREDWTIRNQFVYNKNWLGTDHQLTLLAGSEVQSSSLDNTTNLTRGYNDDLNTTQLVDYKTLASSFLSGMIYPTTGGYASYTPDLLYIQNIDTRVVSYYSNLAYTFKEKYGINASWRIDQSNLFGKDKSAQNKPVWSIGGLWNMGREKWLENATWLNELKLRATYGITGNSPSPGTAASSDILLARAPSGFTVPDGTIYQISSPANRRLTWELTKNTNIGVDFGFFKGRLSGSLDLYMKKSDGLLDRLIVNPFASAGSGTIYGNAGKLENKGIELSLNTINLRTGHFSWRTLINGAYNTNKITKSTGIPATLGSTLLTSTVVEGYSSYPVFAYDYQGLDAAGDPLVKLNDGQVIKTPNFPKAADMVYMGTTQPKWSGGFNNTFQYQNFDLQVNMVFNAGHVMRRDVNLRYTGVNAQDANFHSEFAERWQKAGDEQNKTVPSFVKNSSANSLRSVNYYISGNNNVLDASFAKIRDITLSYRLPDQLLKKFKIDQLRLFAQMGNIMVWKANKFGIDPEFQSSSSGSSGTRSLRTGQNSFSIGANVSF